jgi:protein-L-isoaspartate(D-aspartate) O-methyltransferase
MVERQLRRRGIGDERVLAAMAAVPRELFLPEEVRDDAHRDGALPIGEGQTMSQPWIVACMTALIEPRGDERVLEVGTGSGYGAAVLAACCREVVTIERHEPLAARARELLASLGFHNVEVRSGDGSRGAPDRAPFDAIVVSAAFTSVPQPLVDQLAVGGRLVQPVGPGGEDLVIAFERTADGLERRADLTWAHFVKLYGAYGFEGI